MIKVSPSILSADFFNLCSDINCINNASMLHIDVMDGHFVDNISIGVPVVNSINKACDMFLDVHLMISEPLKYIESFVNAGADLISFHIEANSNITKTIEKIHKLGCKSCIAIKPNTPISAMFEYLHLIDMVLIMTVEPGFGGQSFIPQMCDKIAVLRQYVDKHNLDIDIQVDGGINLKTAKLVQKAGANVLVAGSFIFNSENPREMVEILQKL